MFRFLLRRIAFEHPERTVAVFLAGVQLAAAEWVRIVWLGGAPARAGSIALAAAVLIAANLAAVPLLRRVRGRAGGRAALRLYLSFAFVIAAIGGGLAAAWILLLPSAAIARAAGGDATGVVTAFRAASVAGAAALAAMLGWGFTGGQRRFRETRLRVSLPGLPVALRGLRLVQLSDLHIGNGMEGERLAELVDRTNALDPDLVALTGDLFDFDPGVIEAGVEGLARLRARLGVYAVFGNHDRYAGTARIAAALAAKASHVRLLRGERVRAPGTDALWISGIDDPGTDWTARNLDDPALRALAESRPAEGAEILLAHRPEVFPLAAELGFRLVLAGHTHGGQIALPTPGGRLNVARWMTRFDRGLHRIGDAVLYVHRGCGVAGPPIRFNCSREILVLTLD